MPQPSSDWNGCAIGKVSRRALLRLVPSPSLPLSEWIETHLRLPADVSATPGAVRLWPYQRAIADAIGDPALERVTLVKSVGVGFTTLLPGPLVSFIANEPAPILALLPTEAECCDYEALGGPHAGGGRPRGDLHGPRQAALVGARARYWWTTAWRPRNAGKPPGAPSSTTPPPSPPSPPCATWGTGDGRHPGASIVDAKLRGGRRRPCEARRAGPVNTGSRVPAAYWTGLPCWS